MHTLFAKCAEPIGYERPGDEGGDERPMPQCTSSRASGAPPRAVHLRPSFSSVRCESSMSSPQIDRGVDGNAPDLSCSLMTSYPLLDPSLYIRAVTKLLPVSQDPAT